MSFAPPIDHYGKRESWTYEWLEDNLVPGDVFVDIGANVGDIARAAQQLMTHSITVHCFEPLLTCVAELIKDQPSNWQVWPIGLSDRDKVAHAQSAIHSPGTPIQFAESGQPIVFKPFDSLNIQPTIMKIDVDGMESEVIGGMLQTLQSNKLRTVQIEINHTAPAPMAERMKHSPASLQKEAESIYAAFNEAGFKQLRKQPHINMYYKETYDVVFAR